MNENIREFVLRRLTLTFHADGTTTFDDRHALLGWGFGLGVILVVALIYVVIMYVRDGHAIGWFWGTFLALSRLAVYAILATVFLLPGWQNWEETRQESKVVLGLDVSGSMNKQDDPVVEGVPPESRPSRQDKVLAVVGDTSAADGFFKRLQKTNPVTVYRWGAALDEDYLLVRDGQVWDRKGWEDAARDNAGKRPEGPEFTRDRLTTFLKPDLKAEAPEGASEEDKKAFRERKEKLERLVKSTNVGESALALLSKEINNMPQGLVVFSDCRSTEGGAQAFRDLADRAKRAKVPVFVVVVGEDRPETRIEIVDARGPDKARPEDPFPISVDVTGQGLANREINVILEVFKPGQDPRKDQPAKILEKRVPFKGTQLPRAQVEFPITPAELGDIPVDEPMPDKPAPGKPAVKPAPGPAEKSDKPEFKVGDWNFVAKVARDSAEPINEKFHTKEPVLVRVEKKPLRVLLFASAPLRDYQFVRTMMVREWDKRRLELSIYLQPLPGQARRMGIVQDVPPDRMLTRFPDKLDEKAANEDALYNLANYDVILAFDPDWTDVTINTDLVDRWVSQQGGGLVVIAGPIHTLELARAAARLKAAGGDRDKLKQLIDANIDLKRAKPILDLYPVILKDVRLEKDRNTAIPAGLHFTNATPEMEFLKLDEENGGSGLLGAWNEFFRGPKGVTAGDRLLRGFYGYYPVDKAKDTAITVATFKDDTSTDRSEPPYLVIMPTYGSGRLVWLGSGETWRMRQYREVWHERFWTKLVRYAGAGSTGKTTRRIIPSVGNKFAAGTFIEVEAQCFGKDLLPLSQNVQPKPFVELRPPVGVQLDRNRYEMSAKATSGGEWDGRFTARFLLKSPGEYGLDIKLGGPDEPSTSHKIKVIETDAETENTRPDLAAAYELASEAGIVLDRMEDLNKQQQLRQALQRFNSAGEKPAGTEKEKLRLVFDLRSAGLIPDCMKTVVNKQASRGKVEDVWDDGWQLPEWVEQHIPGYQPDPAKPLKFSYVLAIVVGLLSIEWLTRKLLRLA
jgi:hypothetical protein